MFLISFLEQELIKNSEQVVVSILNKTRLGNITVIVPPLQEQQQIVDYLDKDTTKTDFIIEKETKRIELLKEYRQSLISNLVTGKVRVVEEVA